MIQLREKLSLSDEHKEEILILTAIFFASLHSAFYFCNSLLIFKIQVPKLFQPYFTCHIIFQLMQIESNLSLTL